MGAPGQRCLPVLHAVASQLHVFSVHVQTLSRLRLLRQCPRQLQMHIWGASYSRAKVWRDMWQC